MPPAARVADPTTHGAPLAPGPGSTDVLIGGMPAWRALMDQHACPIVSITGPDGVGMVMMGSPTVLIDFMMACRMGDIVVEIPGLAMGPMNPIIMGCPTVMIGEAGAPSPPGAVGMGGIAAGLAVSGVSKLQQGPSKYSTPEAAAVAAMQEANPKSVKAGREYGGWVRKNSDGTFSYDPPVKGSKDGLTNMPDKGPSDVAWYHTHGAADPGYYNENFSGATGDKGYSKANNATGYLATPSGVIKKYDPATNTVTTLKETAPP